MPPSSLRNTLLTALVALVFGFLGAAIWSYAGLADNRTRSFLLANPDMLPQMVEAYEAQEAEKRLADMGGEVFDPFPGVVLGNPQGSKVLVEFTDYNCPYCEASLKDVTRLVAEDPDLKVVIREWPIFEGSDAASRMALAAGLQGKYDAFHKAMFRLGDVRAAAAEAGLDMNRAEADAASDAVSAEIANNLELARALGFSGTPAWIAGRKPIGGAVGYDALKAALDAGNAG
ncbi:DsbA family protein [Erythrobacter sp.]|uniref:DsbA family protein n=1 Tax=Erythrobacter sp. TaxID=1042 RepID=UPI0025F4BFEB|nr:DsbA family protein [Erythrobacter sp.]